MRGVGGCVAKAGGRFVGSWRRRSEGSESERGVPLRYIAFWEVCEREYEGLNACNIVSMLARLHYPISPSFVVIF